MKIDRYRSKSKPDYSFIVPAFTNLNTFTGVFEQTIQILAPLAQEERNVDFDTIVSGEVLGELMADIEQHGAGLMKTEIHNILASNSEDVTD
jgi:hypothetical protein